jgi:hypothetical protein
VTKIPLVALDKSHATFTNDKGYWMKKKSTNTSSSFDSIVYVLSHVTKMQLFLSLLKANDVLPHVPIFNYLEYNDNYYYFEIIWDIQFKCLDDFILQHVTQCKYATWHLKMNLIQNINIRLVVHK